MGADIGVSRSGTGRFSRIFPRRRRINKDAATARARVRARAPSELQNTAAGAAWQLSQVLDVIVARRRRLLASSFVDVSGAVRPTCLRDSAKVRGLRQLRQHLERWKRVDQSARGKGSEWVEPPRRGLLSRAWADRTRGSGSFETESVKSIRTRGIRRRTFFSRLTDC